MQTEFGSGTMWAVPTIDLSGNNIAVANCTPVPFGALQDVTVDFAASVKELYGLYVFPLDVARGTIKVTGKAKIAVFQAALFNQVFGETLSANDLSVAYQESANISANNATVTQGANFSLDLGVIYAANGVPLTRAANAAAGKYVVGANGLYNFSESNNTQVYISYSYTSNQAAANTTWTINNQLLGLSPFFKVVLNQNRRAKHMTLILNRCIASKLSIATKLEDFNIPEFDFSAMVDDAGVLGQWSLAE